MELDDTILTYGYDASSQLTSEARSGAYAYNTTERALNIDSAVLRFARLSSADFNVRKAGSAWDPNGSRTQQYDSGVLTQRTFNAANELTLVTPSSGPPTTNLYDPNGNLTVAMTGSAVTTNTWSPEDRLAAYTKSSGASNQYTYSDDGKRKSEGTGLGATVFTYDDQALMLETDIAGNLQARYTNYPGIYGGLASMRRGSDSSFYGYDTQHSTRILTSPTETVSDPYSYTAFGIPLQSGSGTVNAFRFIGLFLYYTDDDGEVFVGPRILIVIDGRWMPTDPIGFDGAEWNLYVYGRNNPLLLADPLGLSPDDWNSACNHADPCKYVNSNKSLFPSVAGDTGYTICCSGNPPRTFNCYNVNSTNGDNSCIQKCTIKHETKHTTDIPCAKYCSH